MLICKLFCCIEERSSNQNAMHNFKYVMLTRRSTFINQMIDCYNNCITFTTYHIIAIKALT